ncbi:MAG: hypothetical protein ACLR5G_17275 [Eubacteriales bacterium]
MRRAAETAAEASKRNPYSKNYVGNAAPKPKQVVTGVPVTPKPTEAKAEAVKTEPAKAEPVKAEPVKSEPAPTPTITDLSKDIPADYNKLPEIGKISDADYRSMPEITVPSFDEKLPEVGAAPVPSKHDHGEDFHKIVFYYPKRSISERIERSNALFVLWTLFCCSRFLGGYIALGRLNPARRDIHSGICDNSARGCHRVRRHDCHRGEGRVRRGRHLADILKTRDNRTPPCDRQCQMQIR